MPPFKLAAAFGRRKSTSNALDEQAPPAASPTPAPAPAGTPEALGSSFNVLPRGGRKHVISFDAPPALDHRYVPTPASVRQIQSDV
ncbi:MAG: hypothetical protein INR71_05435 [Terriglobus roseus]|nr:hypothetical protein [Terriglobus roseus]